MRALFFLLFVLFIFFVIRFSLKRINEIRALKEHEANQKADYDHPKEMVACEICGVHIPKTDALVQAGETRSHYFCSEEHKALAAPKKD